MRASSSSVAALLAVALALPVGCKAPASDPKPAAAAEKTPAAQEPAATGPVARVNGQVLPRDAFERQMQRTRARFERAGRQIQPALEQRLKENLIRKMVDDELIAQKAKAEGVGLTPAELAEKLKEHKARFGTEPAFAAFLERTGQSEDDVKADLESSALREKLFEKLLAGQEPNEGDAKKYYEDNASKYKQREQVRASHVLFKVNKSDPPEVKTAQRKKAKDILNKAKAKGADFAALAKQYSEGPTAPRGGDLGTFSRGRMVKEFEEAAFSAKPGQVIGPIETQFGFHVIKVFEKLPERQRSYDEVKDSILTSLKARAKSQATRELLRELKASAKVEVLEPGVDLERKSPARLPVSPAAPRVDVAKQALQRGKLTSESLQKAMQKANEKAKADSTAK